MAFLWIRVGFILSVPAFETPDTASYRSGQATRPPLSSALLWALGATPYVILSAVVSTAGFVALAWSLWNPHRARWSYAMIAVVAGVALLPMVTVYEHWLVPDSLLTGLALLAVALASRRIEKRWYPWTLVALCTIITLTKEVGFGIVVLVALVLVIRHSYRAAAVATLTCALLFAGVVLPGSDRQGRVIWEQPLDTEITMERFRVVIAGVMWPDLSPELAQVQRRAAECGMTQAQLIRETFRLTDRSVDFSGCPQLWRAVDAISQLDVLQAHIRNPIHIGSSIERGFSPDMYAMSVWGDYPVDQQSLMTLDRLVAGAAALLPILALLFALLRHRGRRLALVALLGSMTALVAALIDPSSQDRHTLVFRLAAFAIALIAMTDATERSRNQHEAARAALPADEEPANTSHDEHAMIASASEVAESTTI